jgi:hypothetical protein
MPSRPAAVATFGNLRLGYRPSPLLLAYKARARILAHPFPSPVHPCISLRRTRAAALKIPPPRHSRPCKLLAVGGLPLSLPPFFSFTCELTRTSSVPGHLLPSPDRTTLAHRCRQSAARRRRSSPSLPHRPCSIHHKHHNEVRKPPLFFFFRAPRCLALSPLYAVVRLRLTGRGAAMAAGTIFLSPW